MSELTVTQELLDEIERLAKACTSNHNLFDPNKWNAAAAFSQAMTPACSMALVDAHRAALARIRELEAENSGIRRKAIEEAIAACWSPFEKNRAVISRIKANIRSLISKEGER